MKAQGHTDKGRYGIHMKQWCKDHEAKAARALADGRVSPELLEELGGMKEKLGLRHIILMHSRMGGPTVGPAELTYNEYKLPSGQTRKIGAWGRNGVKITIRFAL